MNSIKSNPFLSALAGITLVVCGALYYFASKGGGKYDEAKATFDTSYAAVSAAENIPLYPKDPHRDGKRKALGEYREAITELSGMFDKYRPGKLENVNPQAFTNGLKKANNEVSDAFKDVKCTLPEGFFMGFEEYNQKLANQEATGALGYQLDGIRHALLGLADARPSELVRIHRDVVVEENGGSFQRKQNQVAREFPFELTFKGSEESARKFISYLAQTDSHYYVVRCVKIVNERNMPPTVEDGKFETSRPAAAAPEVANPFGDFFLPTPEPAPEEGAPAEEAAPVEGDAAAPVAEEEEVDSSRILAQVLGSEEIIVFVRVDLLMFLPSKELPKP